MDGDSLILSQPLPTSLSLSLSPCDAAAPVGSSVSSKQQSWRQWSNRSHWIEVRRSELCSLCMSPERLFSTFFPPQNLSEDLVRFWCFLVCVSSSDFLHIVCASRYFKAIWALAFRNKSPSVPSVYFSRPERSVLLSNYRGGFCEHEHLEMNTLKPLTRRPV